MSPYSTYNDDEQTEQQPASRADPRERVSLAGIPTGVSYILQPQSRNRSPCGDSGAYDTTGVRHAEVA
ncbi:hypothetical protein [Halobacterium noricense]|uniref:hypothetical protein n=1 Tax=Halobacterium noricense TaxID=223182 RepID=UPI001E33CF9C|nr:hypothetical protein [Halobacterium noricense]UHH26440.1 hypothetical protein LT974_05760 [Halobacterium noricense]